jgi:hypothetical protein
MIRQSRLTFALFTAIAVCRPSAPAAQQEAETGHSRATVIPVKILVDDNEPAVQRIWEERLRKRIRAASQILDQRCHVQLCVILNERPARAPREWR